MKKIIQNKKTIFLIMIAVVILCTSVYYAATIIYDGVNVGYNNTNSGANSTDVQAMIDEIYTRAQACSSMTSTFSLGDYFTLVPDSSSYTIYPYSYLTNSSNTTNTITPSELTLWRVIYIHSDGSVDAVSEYVSSTNITFSGQYGYRNYIAAMQDLAAQYAKAGYTIDTRIMGYGGQTAIIPTYSDSTACSADTVCKTTTSYALTGSERPSSTGTPSPTIGIGQEYLGGIGGDTLYLKDYQLVSNVYKSDKSTYGDTGLKATNPSGTVKDYWIASRYYIVDNSYYYYAGRRINTTGDINYQTFRSRTTSWSDFTRNNSIRPIITLKAGVTKASGSGTKTNPYILN